MSNAKFEEIDAPAHWASALINGDTSGLDDADEKAMNEWLAREAEPYSMFYCVGAGTEDAPTHFARFNGLMTEMLTYTFQVQS